MLGKNDQINESKERDIKAKEQVTLMMISSKNKEFMLYNVIVRVLCTLIITQEKCCVDALYQPLKWVDSFS
jgi:hypothetical protein